MDIKKRFCESCGKELVRKVRSRGDLEAPKQYATRKYCNKECVYKGRIKQLSDKLIILNNMLKR